MAKFATVTESEAPAALSQYMRTRTPFTPVNPTTGKPYSGIVLKNMRLKAGYNADGFRGRGRPAGRMNADTMERLKIMRETPMTAKAAAEKFNTGVTNIYIFAKTYGVALVPVPRGPRAVATSVA